MLILSRKLCEQIVIPQCQLSVTVFEIQGNMVRLGISAPPEVAVHREELWRKIMAKGSDVPAVEPHQDSMDALAARLSDVAYQIALRHGLVDSWIDLQLDLWATIAMSLKKFSRRLPLPVQTSQRQASNAQSAH